ncbi:MAG TPA: nucleoside deaminase [Acidobacteriaceae bacterium]
MAALVAFTAESFATASPVPFGAALVHTATGSLLVQARNAVMPENDPSAHAELRAVRLACSRLGQPSLAGYTLYSTCEPCPMCMANALWAGVERLVYGATIADASRHCRQIFIPAAEVIRRSDMECALTPEVSRELCVALFHHPAMLAAFATWSTRKA